MEYGGSGSSGGSDPSGNSGGSGGPGGQGLHGLSGDPHVDDGDPGSSTGVQFAHETAANYTSEIPKDLSMDYPNPLESGEKLGELRKDYDVNAAVYTSDIDFRGEYKPPFLDKVENGVFYTKSYSPADSCAYFNRVENIETTVENKMAIVVADLDEKRQFAEEKAESINAKIDNAPTIADDDKIFFKERVNENCRVQLAESYGHDLNQAEKMAKRLDPAYDIEHSGLNRVLAGEQDDSSSESSEDSSESLDDAMDES